MRLGSSFFAVSLALAIALAGPLARAQDDEDEAPPPYELALSGPAVGRIGRTARFRGVTYQVRGLAELNAWSGRVRGRHITDGGSERWVDARSDAHGRFELALPIGARGESSRIEVEVGGDHAAPAGDGSARAFELPLEVEAPWVLELRTDRNLYEPGEPVHVWLLVRDAISGAPATGRRVAFELRGPAVRRSVVVTTSEAGVAHIEHALRANAEEGSVEVTAAVDDSGASTSFRVGQRTWERLFARASVEPGEVAPGAAARVRVDVTTPDAVPVRGASVEVHVGSTAPVRGVTDSDGRADVEVRAPAYLEGETGTLAVQVRVAHSAHGSVEASTSLRLAVPLAMEIEIVPAHGALVPEIADAVFVQLADAQGNPPPPGTEVEVEGAAFARGRARGATDENGIAEIAARLPRGASAGGDDPHATVRVHVRGGPLERTARIAVPVATGPDVLPTVAHPVAEPGATIDVHLARRPDAMRFPVVVELLDPRGEPCAIEYVAPGVATARLAIPAGKLGRMRVRARAIREDESLEGIGGTDELIVRPPAPDFVTITAARERWRVGETAELALHTNAGGPRAWAALSVRDLAAHGGEVDFAESFLEGAFDRALLEASGEAAERLLRAALAAASSDGEPPVASPLLDALGLPTEDTVASEIAPERGVLRDPWPIARELERRGIGAPMVELESALAEALANGTLDEIAVGAGRARRFVPGVLDASDTTTLADRPITHAMLEAVDPSFTYDAVARRVARVRLIQLLASLAAYLDPGDEASIAARTAGREPWQRWLHRMIERGVIDATALHDPWGGRFALRASRAPAIALSPQATGVELVSPGPDGRLGTADDYRDPFARAVTAGTPYAVASGEDALMRQLAILSPADRTLAAIREAYARINAEITEDQIGDAVHADVSEGTIGLGGLGTIGHGSGGGGSGSGYGRGAGGFRGRVARAPALRIGGANLARVVRERFPPTIAFRPEIAVSASGTTPIEVPLADAVTSYRVEVIVWREDGWIWSARTQIASDRDVVIDAPIPEVARVGDRLILPVRVQNRGGEARQIQVRMLGDARLGIADTRARRVRVPAGGAAQVPIEIALSRRGSGQLRVVAETTGGAPLDAVRRPIRVVAPARRVRATAETLVERRGELAIEVPDGADAREGHVRIAVGAALFDALGEGNWASWAEGRGPIDLTGANAGEAALGLAIGAAWAQRDVSDAQIRAAAEMLVRMLDGSTQRQAGPSTIPGLTERACTLIGLAPAMRRLPMRRELAAEIRGLVERLSREVSEGSVVLEDEPEATAISAAALGWSGGARARTRVAELVRRLSRSVVEVGDDLWLATAERPLRATVLLAMAELTLGRRARAFALLATVARWKALGHTLREDEAALARVTAARLGEGRMPRAVRLVVDGTPRRVRLVRGRAELALRPLAAPGAHTLAVEVDGPAPVHVAASLTYGVPWDQAPPRPGPFAVTFEGEAGARDHVAELEIVVVNRSPRWIAAPIVEVELPTGAELPETEHARIRARVTRSELGGATLALTLGPLAPGAEARVPLPVRWSIAGVLQGVGVAAWAADRPDAVSLLAPRRLRIAATPGVPR